MGELTFAPIYYEYLTAEQYLNLTEEKINNVASIKIIPPKLGEEGFGKIFVEYIKPIYQY